MGAGVRQFLMELEENLNYSEHTITAYQTDLFQFEQVTQWGSETDSLVDLTRPTVSRYVQWLHRQGYRDSTIGRKIAAVRSFLQYACKEEGMSPEAFLDVLAKPDPVTRSPVVLSRRDVERLLEPGGAEPREIRNHALLHVLLETGMRPSTLADLVMSDVDWQNARLQWNGVETELHRSFAPLQAYVLHGRPHFARHPTESALFLNQRGTAMTRQGIWRIVRQRAEQAGLGRRVSPKSLRHTFARRLLEQGATYRDVQERMDLSSSHSLRMYHRDLDQ